jgi:SEC-C motif-containing protein
VIGPFQGCPCGSGSPYAACCGPLLDGQAAETAEALMRSRYTAYAVGDLDHLFRTWHPRTRPEELRSSPEVVWVGLEVLATRGGGRDHDAGTVEFRATFGIGHGEQLLHETSYFERRGGRWVYVDGAPH